jgi:3-hydroxy-9,10-secoandrosta-1,3,5(10)-triene-9,17-dione monooxygenase reductase component
MLDSGVRPTAEELRAVMGRFATGVTVVTTAGEGGRPLGSTANAVSSVSLSPPLVLVCLREESETLAALRRSGVFAINVLAEDQRGIADRFARRDAGWDGVHHEQRDTGSPLLDGTLATLDCAVHDETPGGDHAIVIGRVLGVRVSEGPRPPLLFSEARYHGIGEALASERTAALPSRLGDLEVSVREWTSDGSVSMVATIGEGRDEVYVHRGCVVGDLLDSCCGSRSRLHDAVRDLASRGGGVVVYHRPAGRAGTCEAAGGTGEAEPGRDALDVARAAGEALR